MNRLLAVGFSILELSKLVMYSAYYEQLLPRDVDDLRLLFHSHRQLRLLGQNAGSARRHGRHGIDVPGHIHLFRWASSLLRRKQNKTGIFQILNLSLFSISVLWTQVESAHLWTPTSDDSAHTFTLHEGERRADALRQETGTTPTIPARVERVEHHDVHFSNLQIENPRHHHSQSVENMSDVYRG